MSLFSKNIHSIYILNIVLHISSYTVYTKKSDKDIQFKQKGLLYYNNPLKHYSLSPKIKSFNSLSNFILAVNILYCLLSFSVK